MPDLVVVVLEDGLDLPDAHHVGQVLLVGQHEEGHALQVLVGDHLVEGGLGLGDAVAIVGVHRVDDGVALAVVLVPQRLELLLTAEVPEVQPEMRVMNILSPFVDVNDIVLPDSFGVYFANVEPDCGGDFGRVDALVVPAELGLGRFLEKQTDS